MGEKIRTLANGKLGKTNIEIEENTPHSSKEKNDIHIQTNTFRYQMKSDSFIEAGLIFLSAAEKLSRLKKLKDDS